MKRFYITITLLLVSLCGWAQADHGMTITGLNAQRNGENMEISFSALLSDDALAGGISRIYMPVVTDGEYRVSLPAIVAQGHRAVTSWSRREWAAGIDARYENAVEIEKNTTTDYRTAVPFQEWMYDSRIEVESVVAGCGTSSEEIFRLAGTILPKPQPEPVVLPEPEPEPTTGEILATTFPFVLPASDFNPEQPIRFYDDERDNALTVYYQINSYRIEPGYVGNQLTLNNLIAAIEVIRQSPDARVERVVVAGFASPEGPFSFNDRLAWERAVSVKEFILQHSDMPDQAVYLFNGSADWRGFHLLVSSDPKIPGRRDVLNILESRPFADVANQQARMEQIKRLRNGETYRYMTEHIFPLLRNGAFIRVYFENKQP